MRTVHVLHGDPKVASRLRETIEAVPGLAVTGTACNLAQARDALARDTPDLLVADLFLPDGRLRTLLAALRGNGRNDRPLVVVLSMSAEDARLVDALRHGADGYYAVGARPSTTLADAIAQVLAGESPMSPQIARAVKAHFDAVAPRSGSDWVAEAQSLLRLSEVDQQLLAWTAEGYVVDEIARSLQLTAHGVGVRMRHIYRKLQFDLRANALSLLAA